MKSLGDPRLLFRYQYSRVVIALLGGLAGFCGLGLSLSMSGTLRMRPEPADIGALGVIGMCLAVLLVIYPWWPIVRWLAAAAIVLAPILLMDLPIVWQIGLGVVGTAASLIFASVMLFLTTTVGAIPKFLREAFAFAIVIAATTVALSTEADAQINTCRSSTLSISAVADPGTMQTWSGANDEPAMSVNINNDRTEFIVVADSDIRVGSIVVELIQTRPLPAVSPDEPLTIWSEAIRPDHEGRGRSGPFVVAIVRGDNALRFVAEDRGIDLRITAGEGVYRATFTDSFTGRVCTVNARIRILASPLDTPWGRELTVTTVGLLALASGAVHGLAGSARRPAPAPRATDSTPDADPDPDPDPAISSSAGIKIVLEFDEEERDLDALTLENTSLRGLAKIGARIDTGHGWHVPIEFRTNPRRVNPDGQILTSALVANGRSLGTISLQGTKVTVEAPLNIVVCEPVIHLTAPTSSSNAQTVDTKETTGRS